MAHLPVEGSDRETPELQELAHFRKRGSDGVKKVMR